MFDIVRKYSLSSLGTEWADCYLAFHPLTLADAERLSDLDLTNKKISNDRTKQILQEKFVEGKAIQDGKMVDVTKETLLEFPVDILMNAVEFMMGTDFVEDKKKLSQLATSTEVLEEPSPQTK